MCPSAGVVAFGASMLRQADTTTKQMRYVVLLPEQHMSRSLPHSDDMTIDKVALCSCAM